MSATIALGINFHNDSQAMRGLLEQAVSYFDNIYALDASPSGKFSTDGSVELLNSFGVKPVLDDINKGFGYIRTKLIHDCGCDWVMIMDCDERFYPTINVMTCEGTDRYPAQPEPNLIVTKHPDIINQGAHLKNQIQNPELMAIRATRRHWFDFTMTKPAENWMRVLDHQLRIVRNHAQIHYTLNVHERLVDDRTGNTPRFLEQDPLGGIFYDHFHLQFRKSQPGHKEHNEAQYQRLERGEKMLEKPTTK